MKVVINSDHGVFCLSHAAIDYIKKKYNRVLDSYLSNDKNVRTDSVLIEVIEALGKEANGNFSNLKIIEVPDDVDWLIQEYDGREWVAEKHRTWH